MANSELVLGQTGGNWLDTQQLIAPVFFSLVASTPLNSGNLFIYNNTLYKATADIAQDAPIIISGSGANAVETDNVANTEKKLTVMNVEYVGSGNVSLNADTFAEVTLTSNTTISATDYYVGGVNRMWGNTGTTRPEILITAISVPSPTSLSIVIYNPSTQAKTVNKGSIRINVAWIKKNV